MSKWLELTHPSHLLTFALLAILALLLACSDGGTVAENMPPYPPEPPQANQPCPADFHEETVWHPLVDPVTGCYYGHEHHDNPHLVDDVFDPVGAAYGGQEISYPWQTFSHHGMENVMKHNGYKWLVRKNAPCYSAFSDGCVTDFRVQVHAIMAAMDVVVRYHSFWLEARGCREDNPGVCGIIRTGGWIDYGHLEIDGQHVPLPNDPPNLSSGSRRIHYYQTGNANFATWYGNSKRALVAIQTNRMWSVIKPDDPHIDHFFCPDLGCRNNASMMEAHAIGFNIPASLDTDGDGIVNFSGYTDRYGNIVTNCSSPSLDCVPLEIINMPVGMYQYRDDGNAQLIPIDYDTSPDNQYWVRFPN